MMEGIKSFLETIKNACPKITQEDLVFLATKISVTELQEKQFYIHANSIQKDIGFIYSGLVRAFFVDEKGNEITVNFIQEGGFVTHYSALLTQKPSKYYFQCLEPTIIVNLPYNHIQEGYSKFPNIESYGRLIAEEVLKTQQNRIESFLFQTAEQRYVDFIKFHPTLFNRISISHLCSFLGIERQTLTRIRKKLTQKSF
jgi:CRP/FNR family transcriptional regulator, anaerobic regulatory protein